MLWWLTVFFFLNNSWIPGDRFDGWGSRAYASYEDCEARRHFADDQTRRYPLDMPARWVCNKDRPATSPPQPMQTAKADVHSSYFETHWYEPSNPLGLELFTRGQLGWIAEDGIGLRYTGPLRAPFAEQLRRTLLDAPQKYNHVILELDSDGGDLSYVEEIISVLTEVRARMELTTRVTEGSLCASGCIPVFLQGEKRKASGSSIWVFHGARTAFSNIPDPVATKEYLDLLSTRGLDPRFRSYLESDDRIYRPGSFILSGYEVYAVHDAGIITELFEPWREEAPVFPSGLGPR